MATVPLEKTVIFAGPSLYGVDFKPLATERVFSPAKCGDIVSCVLEFRPKQIVLIDGVFHQSLAVWHKELLWALLEGVVCIGAASMGALRAAELHRYGMIGIGKIFEMYRDGEEDDSLVAMTFDPETNSVLSDAPLGQEQKQIDALAAIDFARSYTGNVSCPLDRAQIFPYVERILERIECPTMTTRAE